MIVTNNLQKIRWELNISQRKLERMSGVGHSTIDRLEKFIIDPKQSTMCKLSLALKMPVTDIFNFP